MKKLAVLGLMFNGLCFGASDYGITKVNKDEISSFVDKGSLVYKGKNSMLMASSLENLNTKDLYVVRLPMFLDITPDLEKVSNIIMVEEGDFALVELTGDEQQLAEIAHNKNGACGPLVKLGDWSLLEQGDSSLKINSSPVIGSSEKLAGVLKLQDKVSADIIYGNIISLENMGTRYHNSEQGKLVPKTIADKYRALIPKNRKDVEIEYKDVARSQQDNLVVRIKGTENPDEIVVLGSHIDSIVQWGRSKVAPGADDDASGTATNLEIFRVLMENGITPKRTIEIHGYAAEEAGLIGSADLANKYQKQGTNVVSMVQMDMNLYSGRRNKLDTMWFVSNGTNKSLTRDLMNYAKNYTNVKPVAAKLSAGTSDHQSWAQRGFVAAFPFENPNEYNRKIHTKDDRAEAVGNAEFPALYAKLGLAYIGHYAGI